MSMEPMTETVRSGPVGGRRRRNAEAEAAPSRPTRAEVTAGERRRRKSGDRMASYKLDIFDKSQLDPAYEYRWVNDEENRVRRLHHSDDYDFVAASEIGGFNAEQQSDSESGERVRMIVDRGPQGQPVYAFLMKKRADFCAQDRREAMELRDAQLRGRVVAGDTSGDAKGLSGSASYTPSGNRLASGISSTRGNG